ncbi:MAG: hypothetical protein V4510_01020 [bacterium]
MTPWEQSFLAGLVLIGVGLYLLVAAVRQAKQAGTRPASILALTIGSALILACALMLWAGLRPGAGDLDVLPGLMLGLPAAGLGLWLVAWGVRMKQAPTKA